MPSVQSAPRYTARYLVDGLLLMGFDLMVRVAGWILLRMAASRSLARNNSRVRLHQDDVFLELVGAECPVAHFLGCFDLDNSSFGLRVR